MGNLICVGRRLSADQLLLAIRGLCVLERSVNVQGPKYVPIPRLIAHPI